MYQPMSVYIDCVGSHGLTLFANSQFSTKKDSFILFDKMDFIDPYLCNMTLITKHSGDALSPFLQKPRIYVKQLAQGSCWLENCNYFLV